DVIRDATVSAGVEAADEALAGGAKQQRGRQPGPAPGAEGFQGAVHPGAREQEDDVDVEPPDLRPGPGSRAGVREHDPRAGEQPVDPVGHAAVPDQQDVNATFVLLGDWTVLFSGGYSHRQPFCYRDMASMP